VIKTFSADQTQVSPGAMVKLTFTTADAKEVSLIDQTGMEVPSPAASSRARRR